MDSVRGGSTSARSRPSRNAQGRKRRAAYGRPFSFLLSLVVERGRAVPVLGVTVPAPVGAMRQLHPWAAGEPAGDALLPFASVLRLRDSRAVADEIGTLEQPL